MRDLSETAAGSGPSLRKIHRGNWKISQSLESLDSININEDLPVCDIIQSLFAFTLKDRECLGNNKDREEEEVGDKDGEEYKLEQRDGNGNQENEEDEEYDSEGGDKAGGSLRMQESVDGDEYEVPGRRISHCYTNETSLLSHVESPIVKRAKKGKMGLLMGNDNEILEEAKDLPYIKFVHPQKTPIPEVMAGTKEALIDRLIHDEFNDLNFKVTFLMTYRAFLKPTDFIDYLMAMFWNIPYAELKDKLKAHVIDDSVYEKKEALELLANALGSADDICNSTSSKTVSILSSWFDRTKIYDDAKLYSDPIVLGKIRVFLSAVNKYADTNVSMSAEKLSSNILRQSQPSFSKSVKREYKLPTSDDFHTEFGPFEFAIFDAIKSGKDKDLKKIAEHLTVIDFTLFSQIQPEECLHQAWVLNEKQAPNIVAVTSRFNRVSAWVILMVMTGTNPSDRAALISGFLTLAGKLKDLHNFTGVLEIVSGLGSAPISRLYKSWEKVKKDKVALFEELKGLMSPAQSYKHYRHYIEGLKRPCIPYIGVYLSDLTFIEEGNTDLIEYPEDKSNLVLVHFEKFRLISRVIYDMRRYIDVAYEFDCDEEYMKELMSIHVPEVDETILYDISMFYEPRVSNAPPLSVAQRKEKLRPEATSLMQSLEIFFDKKRKYSKKAEHESSEANEKKSGITDPSAFGNKVIRIFLQNSHSRVNYYRTVLLNDTDTAEDVISLVLEKENKGYDYLNYHLMSIGAKGKPKEMAKDEIVLNGYKSSDRFFLKPINGKTSDYLYLVSSF
eukprot:Nk52_evm81s217 gene=Nk52_evmTU81s217